MTIIVWVRVGLISAVRLNKTRLYHSTTSTYYINKEDGVITLFEEEKCGNGSQIKRNKLKRSWKNLIT
jgi:hypothetical protein